MTVMAAIDSDSEPSSAVTEGAVFETVRRVNAEALSLLTRRSELNRRIRHLHRLMHSLRDLADKTSLGASGRSSRVEENRVLQAGAKQSTSQLVYPGSAPREPDLSQNWQVPAGGSSRMQGRLQRACRIALMEAGGAASVDDIRSRIIRRGSFSFPDSGLSESAIIQTLESMAAIAEVRRLQSGARFLWQRITPATEIDSFH